MMEFNVEKLTDAGMRTVGKMDAEDMAAMKLCLLSAGTLVGLSVKNKFLRRLTGLTCTVLAAGLAVPLATRYLEELRQEDAPSPIDGGTFTAGFAPEDASGAGAEVTPADFEPDPSDQEPPQI